MKKLLLTAILLFSIGVVQTHLLAQSQADMLLLEDDEPDSLWVEPISINEYNKYVPLLGGDSVRKTKGILCTGQIKDYYPSSKIKHIGYYSQGKLITTFTNYFENGQIERKLSPLGAVGFKLELWYANGLPRAIYEYTNNRIIVSEEFNEKGQPESLERYHKRKDYYLEKKLWWPNGKLRSTLELTDEKKLFYQQTFYYKNGQIFEQGPMFYNKNAGDYQKFGKWLIYNSKGKLLREEFFEHNILTNENIFSQE